MLVGQRIRAEMSGEARRFRQPVVLGRFAGWLAACFAARFAARLNGAT
jgi:hypothetical protein